MSTRFYLNAVTVAAGTAAAAPQGNPWTLENGKLEYITVRVPDGHAGLTGIRFKWSSAVVVPVSGDLFIVANGEVVTVPWDGEIAADALTVETYNSDVWPHTFYLRAAVSDLAAPPAVSVPAVPAGGAAGGQVTAEVADLASVGPVPPPAATQAAEPQLPVAETSLSEAIS